MARYDEPDAGEWIEIVLRNFRLRCCDCDLVHKMDFKIKKGKIWMRTFRDQRATAACRRKNSKQK